jgi:hypothetical protein
MVYLCHSEVYVLLWLGHGLARYWVKHYLLSFLVGAVGDTNIGVGRLSKAESFHYAGGVNPIS